MKFRLEEIEVPEDEPFKYDALKRQTVVEFVRDLIKQLEGPFVLALDSPWGTGKTTVVRMLRASLKSDGFASVYFNAWKEDYVSDPLIPMVAAIDELKVADPEAGKRFGERMATVKKVASKVAKRGFVAAVKLATMNAVDLEEVTEDVLSAAAGDVADDVIESFKQEKASLERFREALEEAVKTVQSEGSMKPLVFFIDELDRCRPTFAIELLERVKHLFDVKNIVFVLSIDKSQLKAITAAVYGERIDAHEYLRRFLDLELALPSLHSKAFTSLQLQQFGLTEFFEARKKYRGLAYDGDHFVETFTILSRIFSLTVRARERCLTRLALVAMQTPENHYLDPVVVSFLIVLRDAQGDLYRGLVSGAVSPRDVVAAVRAREGAREFTASRFSSVIEAYLVIGDVDRERGARVWEELTKLAEDKTPVAETLLARAIVEKKRFIDGEWGRDFSLSFVANKIDLASMVEGYR
ncbi:MAG: P-loop NTPase fold protein [Hydrogenophaga sp.]|uniref:KAP family P-loop NTPase fold protein n=1 Tax=Hydrogenophaga sp. TaxID=1904254 RepID=UPI0027292C00|nr:P-loop NTPase fold protein [Hydrogenophaga sp.]MDO9480500.1 P-loop NTPase fold protein [Hydrogenophaga sp.]MDP2219567.1 P-loop NTPase fold protein [Hydrogenophaga sp.]MDP3346535.1 P-loop NTPase fold protein [Hydrogenophaga sp.]MDP3808651.1 P-loop NTPase fold protein [Hydrogenophaga sp.]MDP3927123.1 P-loop NTPase fold protein [Hydrogenophaga sp.]